MDQLNHFNLEGQPGQTRIITEAVQNRIKEVTVLRRQITEMQATTIEDVEAQDRMLRDANEKIDRLKYAADLLISAAFIPGSAADKRAARTDSARLVAVHFNHSDLLVFRREAETALAGQVTFHWPLEFPEVIVERGGFDAFVGNPPYLGGRRVRSTLGIAYFNWLTDGGFPGSSGNADLCAFFLLQSNALLSPNGSVGLVLSTAIAEGDTRETGLEKVIAGRMPIVRAVSAQTWGGAASVTYCLVWMFKGNWSGLSCLNNLPVQRISSFLRSSVQGQDVPYVLSSQEPTIYQGSIVVGRGFILAEDEAQLLLTSNKRNRLVVVPYLTGEELNSSPTQTPTKWAINFFDWPLDRNTAPKEYDGPVAAEFTDCLKIVTERVKPERTRKEPNGDFTLRKPLPTKWWIYGDKRPALYAALKTHRFAFGNARAATKHLAFVSLPKGVVYSDTVTVVVSNSIGILAILSSSLHEAWSRNYGSTNLSLLRYTPTDCFDTFPFPPSVCLEAIGGKVEDFRKSVMLSRSQGLTDLYNSMHDPNETSNEIQRLRQLHTEMDNAVAAAYGWSDLDFGHGFHETKQGIRYTISKPARQEVLARLLKLNHERYAEEVKQGLHEKKKPKATKDKKETNSHSGPTLFDK